MTDSRLHQVLGHLHPSPTSSPSSPSSPTFTPGLPPGLSPEVPKRIPGPWHLCHPVNGHGRVLLPYMQQGKNHLLMREWRDTYGPVFGFVVYEPSVKRTSFRVVVAEPAEARRLLKLNPPKPAGYQTSIILGEGVLSNTDPVEWARQRNLLKPVFSSPALKELMPVLTHGAQALVAQLREDLAAGRPVNIHEELSAYAFLMIGHSALGEQDEFLTRRAKPLREAFNVAALKEVQRININKDGDYRMARDEISSFTHETFQRYEEKQRAGCPAHKKDAFITIVMGNDAKGCPHMNQKQREDELSTFMFAGHETTAHTMSWAILELARNPQYQKKLQAELDSFIASIGGLDKLEYKDLFKLEYLSLVVNETLRLWPVVANGTFRILDESTEVAGVLLPKDTVLNFPHFLIHRDKKVWGEDADKFVPGRKWFPDSFIPFTVSPRDCLGRNLAMMEMRIILINVFYHFDVTVEDPNLEYVGFNTFTLFPEHGVWVNLHQRSH